MAFKFLFPPFALDLAIVMHVTIARGHVTDGHMIDGQGHGVGDLGHAISGLVRATDIAETGSPTSQYFLCM